MMLKHEIRTLYLQKRAALSEKQKEEMNRKLTALFMDTIHDAHNTIHIYLPIQLKNEINTWPIIEELWELKKEVVVPVMHPIETKLTNCLLPANTQLSENQWGVPEPIDCKAIENDRIDVVVLPLLAFDNNGYRVGYGKGYYDRFITNLSEDVLKIGLSYFAPLDEISDKNFRDIPMDICITPDRVARF